MESSTKRRRTDAYAESQKPSADSGTGGNIDGRPGLESMSALQPSKPHTTEQATLAKLGDAYQYKSNIFKIEMDEMLSEVSLNHEKRMAAVEKTLHHLRCVIENIPQLRDLTISAAGEEMKRRKIHIPFPDPLPTSEVQYKFSYLKPSYMNMVGSYAMKTMINQKEELSVDLVVTMPENILQEKDYLNYRYFHKRAFYLAALAAGITVDKSTSNLKLWYEFLDDDNLRPILVLSPSEDGSITDFRNSKCLIRIIPSSPPGYFASKKLYPSKSSLRSLQGLRLRQASAIYDATPFYNSSVAVDGTYILYLRRLHSSAASAQAFRNACILGRIWLHQRGFGGAISKGGFGNAEWSILMAFLLESGGPKGHPLLSAGYSDYQMFKATLQFLATRDLRHDPFVLNASKVIIRDSRVPVVFDGEHGLNVLFKMTTWYYEMLKHEATVTLECLNSNTVSDKFESVFLYRVENPIYRFDAVASLPMPTDAELETKPTLDDSFPKLQYLKRLYQAIKVGLGDRVSLVHLIQHQSRSVSCSGATTDKSGNIYIGLLFNESNIDRTTDRGPAPEDKKPAASFRKFWGERAELRRYPDGSISESVSWQFKSSRSPVYQIIRYVVDRHLGAGTAQNLNFFDSGLESLIHKPNDRSTPFQSITAQYESLVNDLQILTGLPLALRHVSGSGAALRSASIHIPSDGNQSNVEPVDVIVQFESSGRWPDDLQAIQKIKTSFLIRMGELLEDAKGNQVRTRVGLENERDAYRNGAFLIVCYLPETITFRIRVHHDREAYLLEKIVSNPASGPREKDLARAALLYYRRTFLLLPRHTQMIRKLCHRFPSMSPTMRLMKKWFNSHMFSSHISEELIELLVARTFVQPYPWTAPGSTITGFARSLHLLSNWDWTTEPLVVDLDHNAITAAEFRKAHEGFQNMRKKDPALNSFPMFVATNYNIEDSVWSEETPTKVVAARITALSRLVVKSLGSEPSGLGLHLFAPSIKDFDFVLHMNSRRDTRRSKPKFKNLAIDTPMQDPAEVMDDPVKDFVEEISEIYDGIAMFFWDSLKMNCVGGVWSPNNTRHRNWKPSIAHSTIPVTSDTETIAHFNKDATLHEIARLAGDLISKIDVKSK